LAARGGPLDPDDDPARAIEIPRSTCPRSRPAAAARGAVPGISGGVVLLGILRAIFPPLGGLDASRTRSLPARSAQWMFASILRLAIVAVALAPSSGVWWVCRSMGIPPRWVP